MFYFQKNCPFLKMHWCWCCIFLIQSAIHFQILFVPFFFGFVIKLMSSAFYSDLVGILMAFSNYLLSILVSSISFSGMLSVSTKPRFLNCVIVMVTNFVLGFLFVLHINEGIDNKKTFLKIRKHPHTCGIWRRT